MKLDPVMHIDLHLCFLWKNKCDSWFSDSRDCLVILASCVSVMKRYLILHVRSISALTEIGLVHLSMCRKEMNLGSTQLISKLMMA
jgi:hypothetical protein